MQGKNSRSRIAKPLADIRRRTVMRFTKELKRITTKYFNAQYSLDTNTGLVKYHCAYNIVGNEWICKKKFIAGWQSFNETQKNYEFLYIKPMQHRTMCTKE